MKPTRKPTRKPRRKPMTIATVKCPCGGILFDITRPLMMAVGVTHVKCDSCGQAYAFRVEKGEAHDQTDENGAD